MCRLRGRCSTFSMADFVAGAALCEPPCADFWQAQHFVHLHVQMSWQAQYKMRCGEIANARNAVFFNGTGGSEAGKSRSAEPTGARRSRIILGSCSESSVHWEAQFSLCEPPCADFVAGAALCVPPCADFLAGTALWEPPCADFVAGAIQNALRRDSERTKCCIFQWNRWLRSWQVKVCGTTVARRSRVMLGSFSGMVGIVRSIGIRVFTCFLKCRFRGRCSTL